jgi:hypothetical protein
MCVKKGAILLDHLSAHLAHPRSSSTRQMPNKDSFSG